MRTKQKNNWYLMSFVGAFIALIFIYGCSSEEAISSHQHGERKDVISFAKFKQQTGIKNFKTKVSVNLSNEIGKDAKPEDFIVDTVAVVTAVTGNKTTYSFRIYAVTFSAEENKIFNLVVHKMDNVWEQAIISFKTKIVENTKLAEDLQKIYHSKNTTNSFLPTGFCFGTYYYISCDGTCTGECDGFACTTGGCIRSRIVVELCYQQDSSVDDGGNNDGGGDNGPPGGLGDGTSSGNPILGYINADFEFTPNTLDASEHNFFIGDSTDGSAIIANEFFMSLPSHLQQWKNTHLAEYMNVQNYFIAHHTEADASDFATQLLERMYGMPGVKFDAEISSKSPMNIDISGLGTTPEAERFKTVYNKLTQSPTFKYMFMNMFETTNFISAQFQIDNLSSPTQGNCQLIPYSYGELLAKIKIDKQFLLTASEAKIAKVIMHECIHAYLGVKLRHPSIGMSIEEVNDMDFSECVNASYNGFVGNQDQHTFMVDFMIPTMVQILEEIRDLLFTPEQLVSVMYPTNGSLMMYEPMLDNNGTYQPSSIQVPWSWNAFFNASCLEGLHNCDAFPAIVPPNSIPFYWYARYLLADAFLNQ